MRPAKAISRRRRNVSRETPHSPGLNNSDPPWIIRRRLLQQALTLTGPGLLGAVRYPAPPQGKQPYTARFCVCDRCAPA